MTRTARALLVALALAAAVPAAAGPLQTDPHVLIESTRPMPILVESTRPRTDGMDGAFDDLWSALWSWLLQQLHGDATGSGAPTIRR